jgi:hypothetical protein
MVRLGGSRGCGAAFGDGAGIHLVGALTCLKVMFGQYP